MRKNKSKEIKQRKEIMQPREWKVCFTREDETNLALLSW